MTHTKDTPKEKWCEHNKNIAGEYSHCKICNTPKETKKALMQEAFDTCVEEGRSDFYMLAYIMGVADVDHDTALNFIIKKLQMKQIK